MFEPFCIDCQWRQVLNSVGCSQRMDDLVYTLDHFLGPVLLYLVYQFSTVLLYPRDRFATADLSSVIHALFFSVLQLASERNLQQRHVRLGVRPRREQFPD